MKYVILKYAGKEVPVLFHNDIVHAHMVGQGAKALSAGFVECVDGEWRTLGHSESLNLHPRPQDSALITQWLAQEQRH